MIDLLGGVVAFVLTVIVLSYALWGSSGLFRVVVHLFIGVTAGYVGAVAVLGVLWPQLIRPLLVERQASLALPLVLGVLLFARLSSRSGRWANASLALLVGVGAAAAIGGGVLGTLLPQTAAVMDALALPRLAGQDPLTRLELLLDGIIALVGTAATLAYFHFGMRSSLQRGVYRPGWLEAIGRVGQGFIALTLGVLFTGVFAAALTALVDRLSFLWQFIGRLWQLLS